MAASHHSRQISLQGGPDAKKLHVSSLHLKGYGEHPTGLPGKRGTVITKDAHVVESAHIPDAVTYTPERGVAAGLFRTGGTVDFRLKAAGAFKLSRPLLGISLLESGAAATVTPTKMASLIERLEIMAEGGTKVIQTITDAELYFNTMFLSQEKWSTIAALQNTTSAWGAPTAIGISGTKKYWLPLLGTWFDQVQPSLRTLRGDLVLRFVFRAGVSAGTGVLDVATDGLELTFEQDHPTAGDQKHIEEKYRDNIFHHNYFDVIRLSGSQTFTAGTAAKLSLRGFNGIKVPFLIVALRAGNVVAAEALTTYSAIENTAGTGGSMDLLDSQSKSMLGAAAIPASRLRYMDFIKHTNSQMTQNLPVYLMSFSSKAKHAFHDCSLAGGYVYLTGEEFLQITPSSSFSTGTFYYDILAYQVRTCDIEDGKIDVHT